MNTNKIILILTLWLLSTTRFNLIEASSNLEPMSTMTYGMMVDQVQSPIVFSSSWPQIHAPMIQSIDQNATKWLGNTLWTRLATTIAWDIPLTHLGQTFNHEYFGHAFRARQWGCEDIGIQIKLGFPYAPIGELAGTTYFSPTTPFTPLETNEMNVAGVETTTLLKNAAVSQAYLNKTTDYSNCLLILYAKSEPIGYTLFDLGPTGDPMRYAQDANFPYKDLKIAEYGALLSPIFLWSLGCSITHVTTGQSRFEIPTIGEWEWLIDAEPYWSPLGLGYEIRGSFLREHQLYTAANITGSTPYFNLGYQHLTWLSSSIPTVYWSWMAEIWTQPPARNLQNPSQWGGLLKLQSQWKTPINALNFLANIGCKTDGFSPGYSLYQDYFWQVGVEWQPYL